MPETYHQLLKGNKEWVAEMTARDPDYFKELSKGQEPKFLWIGCSDSRMPANEITRTNPGEVFVHRNIANMVVHTDINMLSVLQYSVEVLKVKHIVVCGHYGCGGIKAAMGNKHLGLIDNWLRNIKDVYRLHSSTLQMMREGEERERLLTRLNVREQVLNLAKTEVVQRAWEENRVLHIHGWVYDIETGLIEDLDVNLKGPSDVHDIYQFDF
jgi:carbonic anhydrase